MYLTSKFFIWDRLWYNSTSKVFIEGLKWSCLSSARGMPPKHCCCCLVARLYLTLPWPHGQLPRLLCPWDFPGKILGWLSFPSPGDLPNAEIEPEFPVLQADSLLLSHQESPIIVITKINQTTTTKHYFQFPIYPWEQYCSIEIHRLKVTRPKTGKGQQPPSFKLGKQMC